MLFTVATWNVNSLRVRLNQLLDWLKVQQPDVMALQETKLQDDDFPLEELRQAGYHVVYAGQKTYNGVALLSKKSIDDVNTELPQLMDPQRRLLAATTYGMRIINLYVPNGESLESTKFQYKLTWLENLAAYLKNELVQYPQLVVLGDFNIAPAAEDVHDPEKWQGQVLVSEPERNALKQVLAVGVQDTFRLFAQPENSYSWWDYRQAAFRRNHGLRIDHILASLPLAVICRSCAIDKAPRAWERPSDHAPVMATFEIPE